MLLRSPTAGPGRLAAAGGREEKRKEHAMIVLTKRNNERFLLNHNQIESIEMIPESKIVMMNRDYFIVKESPEDIVKKIQDYNAKVQDVHRVITVNDRR